MEEKKIEISYQVLKIEELSKIDAHLMNVVNETTVKAYAPYSNFKVGAAVMFIDGCNVRGSNQENAAYPSGMCAERVALFAARTLFPDYPISTLGVIAKKDGNVQSSISLCGACRQVLLETEQRQQQDIRVILFGRYEAIIFSSAKDLLPFSFGEENLLK